MQRYERKYPQRRLYLVKGVTDFKYDCAKIFIRDHGLSTQDVAVVSDHLAVLVT